MDHAIGFQYLFVLIWALKNLDFYNRQTIIALTQTRDRREPPGLVVKEGDSLSSGCGFEFQQNILDDLFTFISFKNEFFTLKRLGKKKTKKGPGMANFSKTRVPT